MLSHPNKELKDHLEEVYTIGMSIFNSKNNIYSHDNAIKKFIEIVLKNHDCGKATSYFQNYIINPEKYNNNEKLKSHSLLSALVTYYKISNELNNINSEKNKKLATFGFYIVLKHHGSFNNLEENTFYIKNSYKKFLKDQLEEFDYEYFNLKRDDFFNFVKKFMEIDFDDELELIKENKGFKDFLFLNYMFSILISADKGAAIYASNNIDINKLRSLIENKIKIDENIVDKYKKYKNFKLDNTMNIIRENIYQEVEKEILKNQEERIFSINVPTGTGKTLASFNAALKLKSKLKDKYKIIYSLPFTSIIDQNFSVFKDILGEKGKYSNVILRHHYLSQKNYNDSNESLNYDISEYLIENWDSEIIVTTFVQFFQTLFSNKNRKLKKYHCFSNSIIILDEIQALPHKYWNLINKTLKILAKDYNSYIILVTATMPLIFSEEEKEIKELAIHKKNYFNKLNRIILDKSLLNEKIYINDFIKKVEDEINFNKENSFLIVLNTIKSSVNVYNELLKKFSDKKIYYLSSNIIPKERMDKINKIKTELKNSQKLIVVSTQLIEAGVDIDFDVVFRDFSTLDSINQTCGRCNRNSDKLKKGKVKLFRICDDNKEYSKYIYDSFLLDKTFKIFDDIKEDNILEKNFYSISKNYFNEVKIKSSEKESRKLIKNMNCLEYDELNDKKTGFRLIPEKFKFLDLFIETDERASLLKNKYFELRKLENKYERKKQFDEIKSEFLSYVISVPEKYYLEGKDNEEFINFIEKDEIQIYYDKNIGFKREEKIEDYIL